MNKMVKSKKFNGIYHRTSKDGEVTYYFTYQDEDKKTKFQKVGAKSQGITEQSAYEQRHSTITAVKNGDIPNKMVLQANSRYQIKVDEIANYFIAFWLLFVVIIVQNPLSKSNYNVTFSINSNSFPLTIKASMQNGISIFLAFR